MDSASGLATILTTSTSTYEEKGEMSRGEREEEEKDSGSNIFTACPSFLPPSPSSHLLLPHARAGCPRVPSEEMVLDLLLPEVSLQPALPSPLRHVVVEVLDDLKCLHPFALRLVLFQGRLDGLDGGLRG